VVLRVGIKPRTEFTLTVLEVKLLSFVFKTNACSYVKGRQLTARRPNPARHAKSSGPRHIN